MFEFLDDFHAPSIIHLAFFRQKNFDIDSISVYYIGIHIFLIFIMKKTLIASIVFCSLLTVSSVFAAGATTTKTPTSSPQLPTVNTHKNVIKGLVILNDYFARDEKKVYGINDE